MPAMVVAIPRSVAAAVQRAALAFKLAPCEYACMIAVVHPDWLRYSSTGSIAFGSFAQSGAICTLLAKSHRQAARSPTPVDNSARATITVIFMESSAREDLKQFPTTTYLAPACLFFESRRPWCRVTQSACHVIMACQGMPLRGSRGGLRSVF